MTFDSAKLSTFIRTPTVSQEIKIHLERKPKIRKSGSLDQFNLHISFRMSVI